MNWTEAVEAMKAGSTVRRKSEMWTKKIADDIVETGTEGIRLMAAWTIEDTPASIFMGAISQCLFVPDDDDRNATDWVVET